jgi:hypothetical protein
VTQFPAPTGIDVGTEMGLLAIEFPEAGRAMLEAFPVVAAR